MQQICIKFFMLSQVNRKSMWSTPPACTSTLVAPCPSIPATHVLVSRHMILLLHTDCPAGTVKCGETLNHKCVREQQICDGRYDCNFGAHFTLDSTVHWDEWDCGNTTGCSMNDFITCLDANYTSPKDFFKLPQRDDMVCSREEGCYYKKSYLEIACPWVSSILPAVIIWNQVMVRCSSLTNVNRMIRGQRIQWLAN